MEKDFGIVEDIGVEGLELVGVLGYESDLGVAWKVAISSSKSSDDDVEKDGMVSLKRASRVSNSSCSILSDDRDLRDGLGGVSDPWTPVDPCCANVLWDEETTGSFGRAA